MSKKKKDTQSPVNVAKIFFVVAIVGGFLIYNPITGSKASQDPGGGSVENIYVDNVAGNDTTGDGSIEKPFKTIKKGNLRANASGAPYARLNIKANTQRYVTNEDIYPKRNQMEFTSYGNGTAYIVGQVINGYMPQFKIQEFNGITVRNLKLVDFELDIFNSENVTIRDNLFYISTEHVNKFGDGVFEVYQVDDLGNANISIVSNLISVTNWGTNNFKTGIKMDTVNGAHVANNRFRGDMQPAVKLSNISDLHLADNRYYDTTLPFEIYSLDNVNMGKVYQKWPF